ncbi:MAG TPA: bifunctional biotin--[acetyl-CoA-carboxylase] ligase/biotin operon repressor BirA [Steroidobacteraceae bacterium]|nr:bifunctional biotin--[acetyl-CoA-carboxylase] ligase/biotin operon repressor BirA [Steroidobacteraceae bacterium]
MKSRRHQTADLRRRRLLEVLANGERHSGEELARQLRVTRSAVWKLIRNLRDLGIEIEAIAHQGYKLPCAVQLYNEQAIHGAMSQSARAALSGLDVLLTVDSTNRYLLDTANPPPGSASVCVAEVQTAGRGRRGRSWVAPFGSGLCLSLAWQFEESPPDFSALSLVIGVAIVRALRRLGCHEVQLKWPNDIVHSHRKLAGVLIDMRGEASGPARVVIGIGMNLHMPAEIRLALAEQQAAVITDLHETMRGHAPERNTLVGTIIDELIAALHAFSRDGFAAFKAEWQSHDSLRDSPVRVLSANETISGTARGVAPDGALLVDVNGRLHRFMSGDVSLRPVL